MAAKRAPAGWEAMPPETRRRYQIIAQCFPGVQIHACGSRVTGRYADQGDVAAQQARKKAGNAKPVSDYDFAAPAGSKPQQPLPWWADRVQMPVPDNEKIAIPVHSRRGIAVQQPKKPCVGCNK